MSEFFEDLISIIIFSQRKGLPFKRVIHFLFNSAPRKFKNLGTDAFIASKLYQIYDLLNLRCICNKGLRSRQDYINCFQLLTFSFLKTNGSEILESHFEIF